MNPQRYRQINSLADTALQLSGEDRRNFLDEACGDDSELRKQVEQLIAADSSPREIMGRSLLEVLAIDMATRPGPRDLSGCRIERYEVLSRLGSGGIGEVWLARDTELQREVALKLLSPSFAGDPYHVRRFQQEARAASGLNHPNIVTIYEIGNTEGVEFIAQERVVGQTLRQQLAGGPMSLRTVLEIGAQVAAALSAAHSAGIVHRDIKPENVMLRPDGLVKVLDFGLARFVERQAIAELAVDASLSLTGFVLGTVRYMSPEQARGLPVDGRSDIFSLGVMLFEMATGRLPFAGVTPSDTLAAILTEEAPPLTAYIPEIHPDFERIIRRCLEKQQGERYNSALELHHDLARLALSLAGVDKKSRTRVRAVTVTAFSALVGIALAVYWVLSRATQPADPFHSMRITRLATRGNVVDSAISRDGKYIAYVVAEAQGQSIWTTDVIAGGEVDTVPAERGQHFGLAFSPDDAYVYYSRRTTNESGSLYRAPVFGGPPVVLVTGISGAAALSPNGRRLAFVRLDASRWQASLLVANSDGSDERVVTTRRRPQYLDQHSIAWSPDGQSIACFTGQTTNYAGASFYLQSIRVSDGKQTLITPHKWEWPQSVAWSKNDLLIVTASSRTEDGFQLWTVARKDGRVRRLTNDLSNYDHVTLTAEGKTLVTPQTEDSLSVWVLPDGDSARATRITSARLHLPAAEIAWTPDGRIVYSETAGESRNLWIIDANGRNRRQLTSGPATKDQAVVTPDGKYVIYKQAGNLWRVDADGSNPRQLTHGPLDVHPDAAPDSRSIVYASFTDWSPSIGGEPTLWRLLIDGGQPAQIAKQPASFPSASSDGKRVAFVYFPGKDPRFSADHLATVSLDGSTPFKVFDASPTYETGISWAPKANALDYIVNSDGVGNIWRQSLGGGRATPVTNFKTDEIFAFAWSRDGHRLACTRGERTTAVVLIENF